ncbi:hypothetical protein GQ568_00725, partial [Patescibacteria group bacterium]|nr:hypothetical protein [Patescibacteria group bacterium]
IDPAQTEALGEAVSSPIQDIQGVFGPEWKPASIFEELGLVDQGIYGAVRIKGMNDVYTIGSGGRRETAESYLERFGTAEQAGIVGEISMEEAIKLGIVVGSDAIVEPLNIDPYEQWAEFRDEDKAELDALQVSLQEATQTLIDQLTGFGETKTEAKDEAKAELGIDEKDKAISDAQKVRNDLYNAYEKLIVDLSHSTMTTAHIGGLQARTRAQRAVEIAPLDSAVLIAQNSYARAKDLLDDWSNDYNVAMQFQMQAAQANIDMIQGELNREQAEQLQEAQIKFDMWQADYNRQLDTQEEVKKLMLAFNSRGANININDDFETAMKKIMPYTASDQEITDRLNELGLESAEMDLLLKKKALAKSEIGVNGLTPSQQLTRMTLFENEIDKGTKQLQGGESWGRVWDSIRRQFPEKTNEEIDSALGGGVGTGQVQGRPMEKAYGWARPGAYEEYKAGTEEVGVGSKWERESTVWQWMETDEAKNLSDEEKASQIRNYGLNPETFGIY